MTKLSMKRILLLTLILVMGLSAADKARLVIGRPGETNDLAQRQNGWYSVIVDAYLHYRIMGFTNISAVPSDSLANMFKARGKYGLSQSRGQLDKAAADFRATHLLQIDYELNPREQTVVLKLKSFPLGQATPNYEFSGRFPVTMTPEKLDSVLADLAITLDLTLSANETAGLRASILMKDYPMMEKLGSVALKINEAMRHEQVTSEIATLEGYVKTNPNFWLAHYIDGSLKAQHGLYKEAGRSFGVILKNKQFAWVPMYVAAVQNYRRGNSVREAQATLKDAATAGLVDVRLTFEDASVKAALGEKDAAAAGFTLVLKDDPLNSEALLYLARYNNDTKNYVKVFTYTKTLIDSKQLMDKAYVENGRSYMGQKKSDVAFKEFRLAEDQLGDCYEANAFLGDLFMEKKQYDSAAVQYKLALKGINDQEELLLKASAAYQAKKDMPGARVILENYASLFPKSLVIERELGLVYFAVKDTVKSRAALERCLAMDPPSKEVFLTLAEIYKGKKEWLKVIAMLEKALPLVGNKEDLYYTIATSHEILEKYDDAEANYRQALAINPKYKGANVAVAELLYRKGSYQEALVFYGNERTHYGSTIAIQEKMVAANYETANLVASRKEATALLGLQAASVYAYEYLARISMKEQKFEESWKAIDKGEDFGKIQMPVYLELARGFSGGKKWDWSIYCYNTFLKSEPNNDVATMEVAKVYHDAGDDPKAVAAYLKAFDLNPKANAEALSHAGHIVYDNKEYAEAKKHYDRYLSSGSSNDSALINHADIEVRNKNFAGAILSLDKLSSESKNKQHVVRLYAFSYYETKNSGAAVALEKALVLYPKDADLHEMAALYYDGVGDTQKAIGRYNSLITLVGKEKQKQYGMHVAKLYEKVGDTASAITQLKSNVVLFPTMYENHAELADVYLAKKEYKLVVGLLSPVVTDASAPVMLNKPLAISYQALGEDVKASQAYEKLLTVASSDSTAWYELGSIYYAQKKYKNAVPALKKATEQMPVHKLAHYRLANSYFLLDDADSAQKVLAKIWPSQPNDSGILALFTSVLLVTKDTLTTIAVYEKRATLELENFKLNVELGDIYTKKSQPDNAATAYARALSIDPTSFEMTMKLMTYHKSKGDEAAVMKQVTAALKYHPKSAVLYYERGMSELRQGQHDAAMGSFDKATKADENDHKSFYQMGLLYVKEVNQKKAKVAFQRAVTIAPDSGSYRLDLARVHADLKEYKEAIQQGSMILSLIVESGPVTAEVGTFYEMYGDTLRAEELYNQALIYDDSCASCYRNLGAINYKRTKYDVAEINLTKAVMLNDTTDAIAAMYLGDIKRSNGDTTEAVVLLKKALSVAPKNDEVLFRYINAMIEAGMLNESGDILKAYKDNERSAWYLSTQGRFSEAKGDFPAAQNYYNYAIKADSTSSYAYIGLGRLCLENKDNNCAMENFSKAQGYDPANIETYILMAKSYFRDKNYEATYMLLEDALKINPKYPDIYYYMAMVHSRKKEHNEAVSILKQALKYNEKRAKIHYALATELRLIVQPQAAITEFEATLLYDKKGEYELQTYKQMGDIYYEQLIDNKNAKKYYKRYQRLGGDSPDVLEKLNTM